MERQIPSAGETPARDTLLCTAEKIHDPTRAEAAIFRQPVSAASLCPYS
jgi:hypothetical protein